MRTRRLIRVLGTGVLLIAATGASDCGPPFTHELSTWSHAAGPDHTSTPANGETSWSYWGANRSMQRFAPVDQIDRHNVDSLEVLWTRRSLDSAYYADSFPALAKRFGQMQGGVGKSVPILVDSVLYMPNSAGLIEAFDPGTGKTLWAQMPGDTTGRGFTGMASPAIDVWTRGAEKRIVVLRSSHLYTVNPATRRADPAFGDSGRVYLGNSFTGVGSSGPIVVGDVIVIAGTFGGAGDGGQEWKGRQPGTVRGYDVATGKLLWTFFAVPREGEFGTDTWGNESYKYAGDQGSWCCLSADEKLGYVYVPFSAPTASYFGGHRPGDNLFANSLVAIDVKTGKRVWHFQTVHHDLWEYDIAAAPTLGDITVDGRKIAAVMQPSKTGFLYVLDRVTGKPVWPIEERPVPQPTAPGEHASPTQPFPTKPAPFDRQGLTYDDLIDWPGLKERARAKADSYVLGSIFTPAPILNKEPGGKRGWIQVPGIWGAGNWHSGAFDPETQTYYVVSHTLPIVMGLAASTKSSSNDMDYYAPWGATEQVTVDGIPIVKPPWGRITAIDMKTGNHRWQVAKGDPEAIRAHPAIRAANPPPLGIANRSVALITRTLLFVADGPSSGGAHGNMYGKKFRAYDKATGAEVWARELPGFVTGAPMSYQYHGVQYIVLPISRDKDYPGGWMALGLRRSDGKHELKKPKP